MYIRRTRLDDENSIAVLIAEFRVELKKLRNLNAAINIQNAKEEFKEYMDKGYPIFVCEEANKLLGYIVLNLIEIRKGTDKDNISTKIRVGEHEFTY